MLKKWDNRGCIALNNSLYSLMFIWKPGALIIDIIFENETKKNTTETTNITIETVLIIFKTLLFKFANDNKEIIIEHTNRTIFMTDIGFPARNVAPIIEAYPVT